MVFSERSVLTLAHGMRFRSDSLRSVGIHDGCQCWAVWTPMHDDPVRDLSGTASLGDFHLVVSPFHPVSWPYLVRIRMALSDKKGVLAKVSAALRDLKLADRLVERGRLTRAQAKKVQDGLNILHQDQAPTGFGHGTWTIVAEVMAVREKHQRAKNELDEKFPEPRGLPNQGSANSPHAHEEAMAFKRALNIDMQIAVRAIREWIMAHGTAKKWLHRRTHVLQEVPTAGRPRKRGDRSEDALLQEWHDEHVPATVHVRGLYELPFHSVYGGGSGAPFGMHYVADNRELHFHRRIDYPGATEERLVLLPRKPHLAIATFDPSEHLLRVVPIPEDVRKTRSIVIEVIYDIRARGASWPGLSKGLVSAVAEITWRHQFSIVSILNKMLEVSTREERGTLRIVAVRSTPMERPALVRREIRLAIERIGRHDRGSPPGAEDAGLGDEAPQDWQAKIGDLSKCYVDIKATCTAPAVHQLFISMNIRHPRQANIKRLLKRACSGCGFEPVFAESYSDTATSLVLKKIEHCDAFLQLLVEPREDQQRRRSWLDFEYGAASGRDLPRMRLVDTAVRPYAKWSEIIDIDRDRYSKEIDLSLSDAELLAAFKRAIREIARRVARK